MESKYSTRTETKNVTQLSSHVKGLLQKRPRGRVIPPINLENKLQNATSHCETVSENLDLQLLGINFFDDALTWPSWTFVTLMAWSRRQFFFWVWAWNSYRLRRRCFISTPLPRIAQGRECRTPFCTLTCDESSLHFGSLNVFLEFAPGSDREMAVRRHRNNPLPLES